MAPGCGTSLTLRTFQMAALDESVIDEQTHRPLKVLVCKEHVPMPKASISSDSLGLKHSTSAPKPAMAGLHRSFMGDRTKEYNTEDGEYTPTKTYSPRSLDQGSHAHILQGLTKEDKDAPLSVSTAATSLSSASKSSAYANTPTSAEPEVRSMSTTTLPKFRSGRFTVAPSSSDSVPASQTAAENAQDPTKDDDSYRTIPVRHGDYDHTEDTTAVEGNNKQERVFTMKGSQSTHNSHQDDLLDPHAELRDVDVSLETVADISERSEHDHLHVNPMDEYALEEVEVTTPHEENEEHKLVDMAFHSKMMDQTTKDEHSKKDDVKVDDDEWDSAPADDYNRRDTIAGM